MKMLALGLMLISSVAFATDEAPSPPSPDPAPIAVGVGVGEGGHGIGIGHGGDSEANAAGGAGGTGNGSVDVGGDTNDYDAKSLALGMIRALPAPAVGGDCLRHTAGWDITVFSKTGATRFDETCRTEKRCFAVADRLSMWGSPVGAKAFLLKCLGYEVPAEPPAAPVREERVDLTPYATKEYVQQSVTNAFKSSQSK